MAGPKPKAQIMRELRKRRKDAGLIKVVSYVTCEADKQQLAKYVTGTLNGECNVKEALDM